MPLNRTRSRNTSTTTNRWKVQTVTTTKITYPMEKVGTSVSVVNANLNGATESLSRTQIIQDQYPSWKGVYGGFSANPAVIKKISEQETGVQFERRGAKAYYDSVGSSSNQQTLLQGYVHLKPPIISESSFPVPYSTVKNEWLPVLVTQFKAEAGNAAAMSIVAMGEFSKTLSLITDASERWSKLVDKAVGKDLELVDRWLRKKKSKRTAIEKARRLGADLVKVMTNKKEFQKFTKRQRSYLRRRARSAEGKLGLYLNGHMEYRYGWKTLVYDIEDHFEALGNVIQPQVTDLRRLSKAKAGFGVFSRQRKVTPAPYYSPVAVDFDVTWKIVCRAGATVKNEVPKPLRQLHAFGMLNPLSSMYELVPLSFVTDWFSNHLDLLKAAENARFNTFYDGWSSARWTAETKAVSAYGDTLLGAPTSTFSSYERTTGLETAFVIYSNPMNTERWTDVVALVWGGISKKIKLNHLAI